MQHESTWCNMLPSQLLRFLHISRYHHVRLLVMPGFSHFSHQAKGSKNKKKLLKLIRTNCWKVSPLAQCFINLRLSGPQPTRGKWRKDFRAKCSQPRQVEAVSASMTSGKHGTVWNSPFRAVSAKMRSVGNSSGKPLDFFMLISTLMRDGKTQTKDSWFPKFDRQQVRGQNQTLFCRTNGFLSCSCCTCNAILC